MAKLDPAVEAAIRRAAVEDGEDPATALAYAERESSFNPHATSSHTIKGLFQLRGDLRRQFGGAAADSTDPYDQTKAWTQLLKSNRATMSQRLGRDVSDSEAYAGHHFGAGRAARMMTMDPATPVDQVFTPDELAQNPHIGRAGTVGQILTSVTGDIDQRRAKFIGDQPDFAHLAEPAEMPDFSAFGQPVEQASAAPSVTAPSQKTPALPDFSQMAEPV